MSASKNISSKSLTPILEKFSTKRLLVVGDLMLDTYLYGAAHRISPEAPVPVVDIKSERMMLGGAGNVVANLVDLGANVNVVGVVGDDKSGEEIVSLLKSIGASSNGVIVESGRETTKKCRVIAGNQQVVRIDYENKNILKENTLEKIRESLVREIKDCDAIVVSDYMKGVVTRQLIETIVAKSDGRLTAVDPKEPTMNRYVGIDLIKPNLATCRRAVEGELHLESGLENSCKFIFNKLNCKYLLVTLGADGMALYQKDRIFKHFPTYVRRVYDVSGAGDTVLAAVSLALSAGAEIEEAVMIGNLAAGIVVEKVGTASVTRSELNLRVERCEFEINLE